MYRIEYVTITEQKTWENGKILFSSFEKKKKIVSPITYTYYEKKNCPKRVKK